MKTVLKNLWKDGKFTTLIGTGLGILGHQVVVQNPVVGELLIALAGVLVASKDPSKSTDKYDPQP